MKVELEFTYAGNGSGVQERTRDLVSHAKATGHQFEHVVHEIAIAWSKISVHKSERLSEAEG